MESGEKLQLKIPRRDVVKEYDVAHTSPEGVLSVRFGPEYAAYNSIPKYEEILLPLLVPILENFRLGKYGIIIGEDASARLCTLVVGELAKKIAKASGVKVPEIKFYAGMQIMTIEEINNLSIQLEKWKKELKSNNFLYVSESLGSGQSITNFLKAASSCGLNLDMVIAENWGYGFDYFRKTIKDNQFGQTIEYLGVGPDVGDLNGSQTEPVIFKSPDLNATTKKLNSARQKNPDSKPYSPVFAYPYKNTNPKIIKATREIAKAVAGNLFLELGSNLSDLYKTINISYRILLKMTEEERLKHYDWIKMFKTRVEYDPRINTKSSEIASIDDWFEYVIYSTLASRNKNNSLKYSEEYQRSLDELKVFLAVLDKRDYPKKISPAVEPL